MPYAARRSEPSRVVPASAESRPGPYESPRRVLRGYDEPVPERLPTEPREAPTRARGRDEGRR